jgi:hypothetical protein
MVRAVVVAVLALGCKGPLPAGSVVEGDWLLPASEVAPALSVPCAGATGGDGPWTVIVDDASGFTALWEPAAERIWLRDPFGVVARGCFWEQVPNRAPEPLPADLPCAAGPFQIGDCDGSEDVSDAFRFFVPGVRPAVGARAVVAADGLLLLPGASAVDRLDLTPSGFRLPGEDERSMRWSIGTIPAPDGFTTSAAATGAGVVLWDADAGRLHVAPRGDAGKSLEGVTRGAPTGPGVLAAAGDFAVIAVDGAVHVYEGLSGDKRPRHDKRSHPDLGAARAAAVHPGTGYAWALVDGGVIGLPRSGPAEFWPTEGGEGLLVARPGGVPTAYVWGNDGDGGVVYRLEAGGVARAHHLAAALLGAGVGEVFQELVTVEQADGGPIVRGWIDQAHLDAVPPGTVGLAMAVFVESPRDDEVLSVADAESVIKEFGLCAGPPPAGVAPDAWSVCCVHAARGAHAAPQMSWLEQRLSADHPGGPAAVTLGFNPSALAPSAYCVGLGVDEAVDAGHAFPDAVLPPIQRWLDAGTASAAVFLHNSAYGDPWSAYSFWLGCPDALAEEADPSCAEWPRDAATQADFYQRLADAAATEPWIGDELDWTMIGGSFEGVNEDGLPSWVDVFPDLVTPDGAPPEDGFYFGLLGMDPRATGVASKELAPEDARRRAFGVDVGSPVSSWDDGSGEAGLVYWPGDTFALPWLYEARASGLLFGDYTAKVAEVGQWETDAFEGDEHSSFMTHADFAAQEHYLVTRVLAHTNTLTPRWFNFHLQNLTRIRDASLQDGWITCYDADCGDTALDRFMLRIEGWGPAVTWSARPPR